MLLTLAGIGIMTMVIGIIYFSGIAASPRFIYGFDYRLLFTFGFFLSYIGLFPILSTVDDNAKNSIKKLYVHLLLVVGIGFIVLIYSFLLYYVPDRISPLDSRHNWFDYYVISVLMIVLGLTTILYSVRDRERLWNFKLFYVILLFIGILLELLSMLTYGTYLKSFGLTRDMWSVFLLFGGVFLYLGALPLFLFASTNFTAFLHRFKFLWILIAFIGFVIILTSYLVYNEMFPEYLDILGKEWYAILVYGCLITIMVILPLVSSKESHEFIHKLRFIWVILFLVGISMVCISAILVLPTSPDVAEALNVGSYEPSLLDISWDTYYMYGSVITIIFLIFICSILFFETKEVSGTEGLMESVERLPGIETTSSEMVAYLEILSKSNDNMVNQFKEAVRADKFRPRVYESIVKQYQDRNKSIKSRIERYQKTGSLISGRDEVETLFDVALGEPSETTPAIEPSSAPTPPSTEAITPTPPPVPPMAPSSDAPPVPPSQTPPPIPPSPSAPPAPSPSPLEAAPPAPGVTPSPPTESPLDLIADARSTSIAELRGEMLKELRRLREIFKEE